MANSRWKCGSSDRFPLLGLQNHCGHWLQPWNQKTIASWQESNEKSRQCIEKQRHYPADKGPYSQGYSLPSSYIGLWELDLKEGRMPTHAFELWCWRRLLEVPWTARRSNQSILRDINPEYSLEGSMLKLKHLMQTTHWKSPWCLEILRAEGEGIRGRDDRTASPMQWIGTWANSWRWWGTGRPMCCSPWDCTESDMTGQLNRSNNKGMLKS